MWALGVTIHRFLIVAIGACLEYQICGMSSSSRFCFHSDGIFHHFLTLSLRNVLLFFVEVAVNVPTEETTLRHTRPQFLVIYVVFIS